MKENALKTLNLKERLFNPLAAAHARAVATSITTFNPEALKRIASTHPFKGLSKLTDTEGD